MKKFIIPLIAIITLIACANISPQESTSFISSTENNNDTIFNFENDIVGNIPNGFLPSATGKQQTLNWKIVNDNGNKVAAQLAKNEGDYYNLFVLDKLGFQNFKMSVKMKAVAGDEDEGGGLIWRCADNNNYYIARCNPLENNFRFYKVVNGNRKQLESVNCNIKTNEWFTMSIEMNGNKISCSLNGNKLIETTDDTFSKSGNLGFWSKADAQSYFDDLTISPIK